jgi:hypothetical protein
MAAALPYCDRLLPGATLADLVRADTVICEEAAGMTDRERHETAAAASGLVSSRA